MSASRAVALLLTSLDIPAHRWRSAIVAAGYTCAIVSTPTRPDDRPLVAPDLLVLGPDAPGAVALALIDAFEDAAPDRAAPPVIRLSPERTADLRGADGEYVIAADAHASDLCTLALALLPRPTEIIQRSWLARVWDRWRGGDGHAAEDGPRQVGQHETDTRKQPGRPIPARILDSDAGSYP